jgi:hypothetical protein
MGVSVPDIGSVGFAKAGSKKVTSEYHSRYQKNRAIGEDIHPVSLAHTSILPMSGNMVSRGSKTAANESERHHNVGILSSPTTNAQI